MSRIKSSPELVGSILKNVVKDLEKKNGAHSVIWDAWLRVVGQQKGTHTCFLGFRQGMLSIGVTNSVWLYEIKHSDSDYVKKMNSMLTYQKVVSLRFKVVGK